MKKLSVLVILIIASAATLSAQRPQGKEMDPEARAEKVSQKMKSDLSLSDDQYKEILSLNKENAISREAKREVMKIEIQAKREASKAEREAYNENMKTILTSEQYVKYLENRNEHSMEHRRKATPRIRGSRGNRN
ncbi:MAG: protein CpxP [Arcticibacterium sp.]|jgi:protein CpxP